MKLFEFQEDAKRDVRDAFRAGADSVCLTLATGSGKTCIAADIVRDILAVNPDAQILFLCHRREILRQALERFTEWGLGPECGIIAPGTAEIPWKAIQIGMIQTVMNRLAELDWLKPALIIIDECHHIRAPTWERVVTWFVTAKVLGLTATPQRLDGKGLGTIFQVLITGPSYPFLVGIKRLAPLRFLIPPMPLSREGLTRRDGNFIKSEAEARITGKVIVAAASAWLKHAVERKTIHFAQSRAHSRHHVQQLKDHGIAAEHVDGDMPDGRRDAIWARLDDGDTQVVSNVNIATEGVDVPSVQCVHVSFLTESIVRWHQAVGRGSRPKTSGFHDNLVLDCGGNFFALGSPEAEIEWTLDGGATEASLRAAASAWRVCKRCRQPTASSSSQCQHCGHVTFVELPDELDIDLVDPGAIPAVPVRKKRTEPSHRQSEIGPKIYATRGNDKKLYDLAAELKYSPYIVAHWKALYADKWHRETLGGKQQW